jgi:calcineurin-like phosphoesterase family protein
VQLPGLTDIRTDIDIDNTWVTSDNHFGHNNIVRFTHRPPAHDRLMVDYWRQEVPDKDSTLLHLGDLAWHNSNHFLHRIAPRLTGTRKLLILGNHDKKDPDYYRRANFEVIEPFWIGMYEMNIGFAHYPWQGPGDVPSRYLHVHGHIHNNGYYDGRSRPGSPRFSIVPYNRNQVNVSVEMTKYRPVNLGALLRSVLYGELP